MRCALCLVFFLASVAHASEIGDWYKSLRSPENGMSCCDVADCAVTDAEWKSDHWIARAEDGEWVAIPLEKVVRGKHEAEGRAVLCQSSNNLVYCFVEPTMGF